MTKGIYCYIDLENNSIVYIGKDSNIHNYIRDKDHHTPSKYNDQPFNRILQNNPTRYQYQVLWTIDNCTNNHLNQMEIYYIKKYDPKFNFTKGGGGCNGYQHSKEIKKKISERQIGKKLSRKTKIEISKKHNTTGFYRVVKHPCTECKQGFIWRYHYRINNKRKGIKNINLLKLKEKVKNQGLDWYIINEDNAKKSLKENKKNIKKWYKP